MTLSLLHRCRRDGTGAVVMAPVPRYTLGEKIGTGHNDGTGAITMAPVPIYQKLTQRSVVLERTGPRGICGPPVRGCPLAVGHGPKDLPMVGASTASPTLPSCI